MANRWLLMIGISIFLPISWRTSDILVLAELSTVVHIKNGTLEGTIMKSRNGTEYVAFLGIPYAQPPLGKLRFEPPKPSKGWIGVRSAKQDANICTQRDLIAHQAEVRGVEDCLYLNVYTPKLPSKYIDKCEMKYPVMVHFHGGGFIAGSGNSEFYGMEYLFDYDIVVVSPNYRLGPLGFLSTEDMVVPGNGGLKDQVQSLRWVQENIAMFGGDPNRVTIIGESAGGVSVHHHMMSPLSRGLFHQAVSQSGTALNPWAISPRPGHAKNQAMRLGKLLHCPTENSAALVECLRTKNARDIIATDYAFQEFGFCPLIPFRPVIEPDHPGAFIKEEPALALKSGNIADVPWMTGINSHEGALKVSTIFGHKDKKHDKLLDRKFMEIAPISLLYEHTCPEKSKDNVTKSIREFYLGDKKIEVSTRWKLIDMYTDALFFIPADNAIRDHLNTLSSPVYYYFFSYRGSTSYSKLLGDAENDYGVCHADILLYFFPGKRYLFADTKFTDEDNKMIDVMVNLLVNFVKSGNPTPEKTPLIPVKWKPVRTSKLEYLHIKNPKNLDMENNLFSDRVKFWASIPYRGRKELHKNVRQDKDEL